MCLCSQLYLGVRDCCIPIICVPFLVWVLFTSAGTSGNFVSVKNVQSCEKRNVDTGKKLGMISIIGKLIKNIWK